MKKAFRTCLSAVAAFAVVSGCTAVAQQHVTPASSVAAPPANQKKIPRSFKLQAFTPEFWELFGKNATLTTMGTGFGFTEGPVWDPAGFLWVSDESKNQIDRLYANGRVEPMVSLVDPDGSTYDQQHRLLSTASGLRAIIRLSADGKSFETVVDDYHGKKLNTPNDIIIGPDGAIYFTDPIIDMTKDQKEELPPSVYRLGADNSMTLLTTDLKAPNGLAFSPDGRFMYIDDDDSMKIRRYDFHKDGTISGGMDFADMTDPEKRGVPDGMKVDVKDRLFVSGPTGIWVWNSKGVHIGTVQLPKDMANLTWGGPDNSRLYITASDSVYILQSKTRGTLGYASK
ncbi:MAG: SMP-30/gluconolactonase/LRE family protein [Acidobacteriota bacterium]